MAETLRYVTPESIITGWDFSTGSVKCLAFDLEGNTVAEVRLPTDLWSENNPYRLNEKTWPMISGLKEYGRLALEVVRPSASHG